MGIFLSLISILVIVLLYLCWFFKRSHTYFNDKCFPTLEPTFVLGNLADAILLKKSLALTVYDLYEKLRPYKYAGLYWLHRPFVMLRDPELIKTALIKDFSNFSDRGIHCDEKEEPLNNNLIRMSSGDKWKCIRTKLSPLFTSGKLKVIITPVQECANKLSEVINRTKGESFEMKELSERFSIDVIGNCAFGMNTAALENPRSPFLKMGKQIFKFRYQPIIRHFFPDLTKFWIKIFNLRYIDKEVETFFSTIIHEAIKLREKSETPKNDLMDLLLALRNDNIDDCADSFDTEITTELIIAQCYLFFSAGFETTSSGFSYLLMELASNQNIQYRVREEIVQVLEKYNGQITNESLKEMTYCDMAISETLRIHPPAGVLFRECSKAYQIPETEATIPGRTPIFISIYGLHRDPEYYEKPNEFYPEHFADEAKNKRPKCSYMPFGEGPRICIGERFAKLEMKIGMAVLLKDHVFELSPKMEFPLQHTFEMNLGLMSANKIWLRCRKI